MNKIYSRIASFNTGIVTWHLFENPRCSPFIFTLTPASDPYNESQVYCFADGKVEFVGWWKTVDVHNYKGLLFEDLPALLGINASDSIEIQGAVDNGAGLSIPQVMGIYINNLLLTPIRDIVLVESELAPSNILPFRTKTQKEIYNAAK